MVLRVFADMLHSRIPEVSKPIANHVINRFGIFERPGDMPDSSSADLRFRGCKKLCCNRITQRLVTEDYRVYYPLSDSLQRVGMAILPSCDEGLC
ncbi:hypothetical protein D3C74_355360 [compost metagenome]